MAIKKFEEQVIIQKDPIEAIRTRPGMFVGSTENADVLLREIVDNSLDEIVSENSPATTVWIYKKTGSRYIVCDNGRGLPMQKASTDPKITMSILSVTSLHSGSKFSKNENLVGMNGVGSKCVNALSNLYEFFVKVNKNKLVNTTKKVEGLSKSSGIPLKDAWYYCRFKKGRLTDEKFVNTQWISQYLSIKLDKSATNVISFIPDNTIYESTEAEIPGTLKFIKYISSYNNIDANIYIDDKKYEDFFNPFQFEFDATLVSQKESPKNKDATFLCSMEIDQEECGNPLYIGSVNGLESSNGVHIKLFDLAFDLAIAKFYGEEYVKYAKKGLKFSIVTLCPEPEFNSQTKTHCSGIPGIDKKCIEPLTKKILKVLKDNKEEFDLHIERIKKIMASHKNLGKIEYIKEKLGGLLSDNPKSMGKLPRCIIDCNAKDRKKCSLFIVEGNSAGGNLIKCRDNYSAVCLLRGKILNTSGMDIKKALENEEIRAVLQGIGTGVDDCYSLSKIRYGKIKLLVDPDEDGFHILSLLTCLFCSYCSYLIELGMVYIVETPLYKQNGKFFYADQKHLLDTSDNSPPIVHYKGLGEFSPADFKVIMYGGNSRETKLTIEGKEKALEYLASTKKKNELMLEEGIIEL